MFAEYVIKHSRFTAFRVYFYFFFFKMTTDVPKQMAYLDKRKIVVRRSVLLEPKNCHPSYLPVATSISCMERLHLKFAVCGRLYHVATWCNSECGDV